MCHRPPISTSVSATFGIVLGAVVAALGGGPAVGAPPPGLDLEPVPVPVLDQLSPADREAVREVRSSLDTLLERDEAVGVEALEEAYGEVGEHYLAHDLMVPAEAALANARRLDPEEFRWPYYLGVLHFREGRLEAARESLEAALELEPDDVPTLLRLGEVHLDQGALDAAEEEFRRVLSLNSLSAMAEWGLGRVAQERDRPREAIERFQRALELQPEASSIHHSLGLAYRDLGDREKAREHFEANRHDPVRFRDPRMERLSRLLRGSRPHVKAGNRAAGRGDLQEARRQFTLAVEADPTDRLAHYNL
ncbi:MAG: tetratricopeptide repeat protein, partial [Thermoanaerobaculia bacterium]|nr:tetratricopeptide repeat protein [Thermoanaerobaculia bacterium]